MSAKLEHVQKLHVIENRTYLLNKNKNATSQAQNRPKAIMVQMNVVAAAATITRTRMWQVPKKTRCTICQEPAAY
jgi:hypothetical protein